MLVELVVSGTISRATLFKQNLVCLQNILKAIAPKIEEMKRNNNALGRSNDELKSLIQEMEKGMHEAC